MRSCWERLCPVDASALAEWLTQSPPTWPAPSTPTKPQRLFEPPAALTAPVVDAVLRHVGGSVVAHQVVLSRVLPGQSHPLHVDVQRSDWLTRVHVPIATNPAAWFVFEEVGLVHFETGWAYSFDTLRRHGFGNDGPTERVHLIFDVLRKE